MMEKLTWTEANETVKQYKRYFTRANVSAADLMQLQESAIIISMEEKKRNGRVYETEKKEISAREFMNNLTWIGFFQARVYRRYSMIGNVIYKMTYVSPDGTESRTIHYEFKGFSSWRSLVSNPSHALKEAGYREKDIMENCKYAEIEISGGHELVHIYHKDNEHSCTWDNITGKFVG